MAKEVFPFPQLIVIPPPIVTAVLTNVNPITGRVEVVAEFPSLGKPLVPDIQLLPPDIRCVSPIRAHVSVNYDPKPSGSDAVESTRPRPRQLRRGVGLIQRLQAYADPQRRDPLLAGMAHIQRRHTWQLPHNLSQRPTTSEQSIALTQLHHWFAIQSSRERRYLGDNHALRNDVDRQLMEFLDYILRYRYKVDPLTEGYPTWAGGQSYKNMDNGKYGGLSDWTLARGPNIGGGVLTLDARPWWIVSMNLKTQIFNAELNSYPTFVWRKGGAQLVVIKELWARMVRQRLNWAVFTNCEVLFVALRYSTDILVLSDPLEWTSPDVHLTMAGLQFAALDEETWLELNVSLRDELCPLEEQNIYPYFYDDDDDDDEGSDGDNDDD